MAFTPFGKDVGPSMNPRPSVIGPFGHFPRTPSPIHSSSGPQTQRGTSPPLDFQSTSSSVRPYQLGGVQRSREPGDRKLSPPLAFQHSRPPVRPHQFARVQSGPEAPKRFPSPAFGFQNSDAAVRPYQSTGIQRTAQALQRLGSSPLNSDKIHHDASPPYPPTRNHRPIQTPNSWGVQSHSRPAVGTSFVVSRSSGTNAAEIGRYQDPKKTRSPPSFPADDGPSRNSGLPLLQSHSNFPVDQNPTFPPRKRSPQSAFENSHFVDDLHPPSCQTKRPFPSNMDDNLQRLPSDFPNQLVHQDQSPNLLYLDSYEAVNILDSRRTRAPPTAPSHGVFQDKPKFSQNNSRRASISPPALGTRSYVPFNNSDSQVPEKSLSSANDLFETASRITSYPAPKRTRSPPFLSAAEVFQGNSGSSQDGTEREEQAKAKRLARFKSELEAMPTGLVDTVDTKFSTNKSQKPLHNRQKFCSVESDRDTLKADALSDYESLEPSSVIIGLCPDMCPASEREERERKGDLDQYERVDGDRNQTSKYLAIKKYTRTAEREANLIRPMPILQKTMDYLLKLLEQPYDDSFLGMYNFLWDRMRAIRMDLRMQHIFNREAITMLEQMIRLHIIAMHELCEYTKGEGFSEGFDAHLNIEQMNKTSVELFQMYDDHRKKGISIPTEKEFRGYYALLKLDKHPGYKVEPAELSLDLAKMTPEIRQTPEVLFARNVARACRTSNFIAFFRLARKASYIQACLMHAHFAKLRTQALASLHSGLLNNQGLPVADVAKWIGLEEEDIETLLEYHGFSIKEFEEPYMMKDGTFPNVDKDYPTKCSKLVHLKKSRTIVEDISPSSLALPSPTEATKETPTSTTHKQDAVSVPSLKKQTSFRTFDEEMPDSETSLPKEGKPVSPLFGNPMVDQQSRDDQRGADRFLSPRNFSSPRGSPRFSRAEIWSTETQDSDTRFSIFSEETKFPFAEAMPLKFAAGPAFHQSSSIMPIASIQEISSSNENEYGLEVLVPQMEVINNFDVEEPHDMDQEHENENGAIASQYDEEVAVAKLKLIIRLWKRWSSRQREFREQRQLAANAALNSLSLGPRIRLSKDDQPSTSVEFDIDQVMRKRFEKRELSWSRLNISNVIADVLSKRNPESECICWKVVFCSQINSVDTMMSKSQVTHSAAGQWLLSKLVPSRKDDDIDDDLLFSSPGVSIWKKLAGNQSGSDMTCCLSVVRHVEIGNDLHDTISGASAVLFLVSESIPWNLQRDRLNKLLMSIPYGLRLPLLIISGSYDGDISVHTSNIVNELGLHYIDKSRVYSFSVLPLVDGGQMGNTDQFFSDKQLREGLQWLASNSPLQPVLHCLKPRELVLNHLSSSLEQLKKMPDHEIGPNHCVSAFNNALDRSIVNIASAAEANPIGWPCPEIELLESSRTEKLMVRWHLPNLGWSSDENVEPLKSALNDCKLPSFHDDMTWLTIGCGMSAGIENQRRRFESCLIEYLTEKSKLMGDTLATKEACVMLQRNTRLELHNSSYYIMPNWVMIFLRIFHWQLMGLSDTTLSSAYVMKSDLDVSASDYLEDTIYSSYRSSLPSLDEIIELGCSPVKIPLKNQAKPEAIQPLPMAILDHEAQEAANTGESMENRRQVLQQVYMVAEDDIAYATGKPNKSKGKEEEDTVSTGAGRLSELLEKCNIVQNSIAKKLSIYF